MDQSVGRVPPEIVGPDEEDVAADPEHRHRADDGQGVEDPRHRPDQPRPDRPRQARASLGQGQPDVVHLDDERDDAIHAGSDDEGDEDEDEQPSDEGLGGHLVEGDDHDLGREDEVGPDRAGDHGLLMAGAFGGDRDLVAAAVMTEPLPDLLGALEAQVCASDHEQRGQRPGEELAEQHRRREDEEDLVPQRAERDPLDDRQLTVGGEAVDVPRRDRRVVDDDAGGLRARPCGCGADVVDRGGGELGQRSDVVEEGDEAAAHACPRGVGAPDGRDMVASLARPSARAECGRAARASPIYP